MTARLLPFRRVAGMPHEMSDEALVAACGAGDGAALGALFDRHVGLVHCVLARMLGRDEPSIEDLIQTTFETVQRSARRFKGTSAARHWIAGVAANVVRHHIRSESRRQRLAVAYRDEARILESSPHRRAERRELVERVVDAALATLPAETRMAFVMHYLASVPGADAARLLGMREGTFWKRLHEARDAVRRVLEESGL